MPTTEVMIETLIKWREDPTGAPALHFWKLVERFRADLVNQAFVILGNQDDAEDVAQETLSVAFLNLDQLRDASKLGSWLRGINRNRAHDLQRRQCRAKEERLATGQMNALESPKPPGATTSSNSPVRPAEIVLRAIDSLPEVAREVLVLRYWEKLSYEEIASRLGVPIGTVCSRILRADRLLAQKMKSKLSQETHAQ